MSTSAGGSGGRGRSAGGGSRSGGRNSRLSTQKNATLDARVRRSNSGAGWRNAARNYGVSS